jgi:hypothetical protein
VGHLSGLVTLCRGKFMSDADKVIYLESLLSEVIHTLEMTQYDIEDATESNNVVMKADKFYDEMLTILHSN